MNSLALIALTGCVVLSGCASTSGGTPNGIKLSIIDKPAWAAAPRQPDAFAQSSCLV